MVLFTIEWSSVFLYTFTDSNKSYICKVEKGEKESIFFLYSYHNINLVKYEEGDGGAPVNSKSFVEAAQALYNKVRLEYKKQSFVSKLFL